MNNPVRNCTFLSVVLWAALLVATDSVLGGEWIYDGNVTVNSNLIVKGVVSVTNNVNVVSNLTAHAISLAVRRLRIYPGSTPCLVLVQMPGNHVLSNLSSLVATTISVSNRLQAGSGPFGQGAFAITLWQTYVDAYGDTNLIYNDISEFASTFSAGDYFNDAVFGDACIRSLGGAIRLGFVNHGFDEDGNPTMDNVTSSFVISSNGQVSVNSGPLIITPAGDLLMGSFDQFTAALAGIKTGPRSTPMDESS